MRRLIISLVAISSSISCNSNNTNRSGHFNIDTKIDILLKNSEGIDLLNPNNSNSYTASDISIYSILNGVNKPSDFIIIAPQNRETDKYIMRVFPYNYALTDVITYIKWNNNDIDTLKTNYKSGNNNTVCSKVWHNNRIVYATCSYISLMIGTKKYSLH